MTIRVLVAADIWGVSPELQQLVDGWPHAVEVELVDAYQQQYQAGISEQQAYQRFMRFGGLSCYAETLYRRLSAAPVHLAIGFSAGGAALWQLSDQPVWQHCQGIIAFYPGQIRNMLHIQPHIPCELVFAKAEPHFCVASVITALSNKTGVSLVHTPYEHGFMNRGCTGFSADAYAQYSSELAGKISGLV